MRQRLAGIAAKKKETKFSKPGRLRTRQLSRSISEAARAAAVSSTAPHSVTAHIGPRTKWLKDQCAAAGIEVLEGRFRGDKKRASHPAKSDRASNEKFAEPATAVYTPLLLRIPARRGDEVEARATPSLRIQRRDTTRRCRGGKKKENGRSFRITEPEEGKQNKKGEKKDERREEPKKI